MQALRPIVAPVAIVILNTGRPRLNFRKLSINFHDVATTNSGTCSPTPNAQWATGNNGKRKRERERKMEKVVR